MTDPNAPSPSPPTRPGTLDLNAVWRHGARLLRENWQLIAVIAGLFVLLPSAALQFALPPDGELEGPLNVLIDPNSNEIAQQRAAAALGTMLAPFLALAGVSVLVAHIGYAAIVALVGRARPTVGEALVQGFVVIVPLVAAMAVYLVVVYGVLIALQLVAIPLGAVGGVIGSLVGLGIALFLTARLALTLPVIVLDRVFNPFRALRNSWRLTARSAGNVFGFWMVLAVGWFVTLMVQVMLSVVLAGIPGPGPTASLIEGLLSGAFSMVWGAIYCVMGAAMFYDLSGTDAADARPGSA